MLKKNIYLKIFPLLFILFIGSNSDLISQNKLTSSNDSIEINPYVMYRYASMRVHVGKHIYTGNTLSEELSQGYRSFDLRLGWQNSKPEHWTNKYYNSTSYGIGFYASYIGTPEVLGTPTAIYAFINFPYGNFSKRTTFVTSAAIGITYNSKYYHEHKNPMNDALGSALSIYVNVGFGIETILTRNTDLLYGINYTHFSNGRIVVPNYGFNMLGLNLGFKYHYNKTKKKISSNNTPEKIVQARFKRTQSKKAPIKLTQRINILTSFGTVQNGYLETVDKSTLKNRYYTFSGYLEHQLNLTIKHGIDTGFDLFYDESLINRYPNSKDWYLYGYHFGYNYTFGKILLKLDLGGYLGPDGSKDKDNIWARAALQYKILNWMGLHLALKTKQGFTADWAELGVVFEPFKW